MDMFSCPARIQWRLSFFLFFILNVDSHCGCSGEKRNCFVIFPGPWKWNQCELRQSFFFKSQSRRTFSPRVFFVFLRVISSFSTKKCAQCLTTAENTIQNWRIKKKNQTVDGGQWTCLSFWNHRKSKVKKKKKSKIVRSIIEANGHFTRSSKLWRFCFLFIWRAVWTYWN